MSVLNLGMVSGLATRNGSWIGLGALVAVLLLGLGLRVGEAWDGRAPVYDAQAYAAIARNLDEGSGFTVGANATQPSSNYSPGLPLLVAGLYELTGGVHERSARVVLAVLGTLSVLFAYLIGLRLGRRALKGRSPSQPASCEVGSATVPRRGAAKNHGYRRENAPVVWPALVGALVVAVFPALLEYQGMLMGEPLAASLLSGGVLAVLWAWEGGWVRWLLPGVLLGALALVRPEYLAVALLVALALVIAARGLRDDWRPPLLRAAVFLAAALVVIAPWTIRNAAALDRFVPISTGGGQVLFAGTYLPSAGDPEAVGAGVVAERPNLFAPGAAQRLRLEQILARLAHARYPGMETDEALSKMGKEQLGDELSEEPGEYLGFVAKKIGRIWFHPARAVMAAPAWRIVQWALVLSAFLGLGLLAWRRRWEALLLGTILLAITLISAVLVASPRRLLVLVPLLAALTSVALVWASGRVATFRGHGHEKSPEAPAAAADSLGAP